MSSWLNKKVNDVFKKEKKSYSFDNIEDRINNLNEITERKIRDVEEEKDLFHRMENLNKKDFIQQKQQQFLTYQRSRFRAADDDNDSNDIKLPSIGGEDDRQKRSQYNEYSAFKNDRFGSNGFGNGNYGPQNNKQSSFNGSSSGQQQCGHTTKSPRPYPSLQYINIPLPRK